MTLPTRVAALQMVSGPEVGPNLEAADRLLAQAAAAGAALAVLPEYFCLIGRRDTDKLAVAEKPGEGPIQRFLADAARRYGLWIVGGTLPLKTDDPARALNSNTVWAPDGTLAARYDKIHLFSFAQGEEHYDEGRVLLAGGAPVAVQAGALRVGLSVCELFRPFSRLHPRDGYAGSGIGLSIVQRIVERHGGTVAATARPGEGACFEFTLAALPPDNAASRRSLRPAAAVADALSA